MLTFVDKLITDQKQTRLTLTYIHNLELNISIPCQQLGHLVAHQCQRYSAYLSTLLFPKARHGDSHLHAQMPHQASVIGPCAQGPARYPSRVLDPLDNWLQRFRAMDTLQPAPTGEWRGCAWPHRTAPVTSPSPPMPLAYFLSVSVTAWSSP